MAYTVLARRYRSQRFDDVVGQDSIATTLSNAIKAGRVAHAYLFCGTRGVGKTTMARILAKSLNCLKADDATITPCLKCNSCVAINGGDDIDVIEVDGASNRGIENIRELRQNAIYRPARARFKIYIIDEVHMLTTEAFNALLKILEEPPSHVKFIFATTEPNKVLPTIQSRCQRFDFSNISSADIIKQLKFILDDEKIKFEEDLVISVARLADGSMRDALSLLDQLISSGTDTLNMEMLETFLGQPSREKSYELVEKIGQSDSASALESINSLLNSGMSCVQIIDTLVETIRDIMVLKASKPGSSTVVLTAAEREKLAAISEHFDIAGCVYDIALLEKLRWPIKNSDNPRALLEASVLRLALSEHFIGVPELVSQIKAGNTGQGARVKKNFSPTPNRQINNPTPVAAQNPPVSKGPIMDIDADLEAIKAGWQKIISFASSGGIGRLSGTLAKAVPSELRGNVLVLSFTDDFAKNLCQSNGRADTISKVISEALGRKINIEFTLDESGSKKNVAVKPRGAKTSKKTMDDVANSPAVKTLLKGLDASILDISENQ